MINNPGNIEWKKVGDHIPSNAERLYYGQPDSPYIPCIVWVCNPETPMGGVADVIRWDTENKEWYKLDMNKWFYHEHYEITHFSDEINIPEFAPNKEVR